MKKKGFSKKDKMNSSLERTVPVLYQNIGGEVYAFAQVGKEMYFGKVPVQASTKSNCLPQSVVKQFEKDAA